MSKKVLAFLLAAVMILSVNPFTLKASAEDVDSDNTVMFAVEDDADGKLYYTSYKYGINGLGYAQKGFLRTSSGASCWRLESPQQARRRTQRAVTYTR